MMRWAPEDEEGKERQVIKVGEETEGASSPIFENPSDIQFFSRRWERNAQSDEQFNAVTRRLYIRRP